MNMSGELVTGAGVRELIGWLVHLIEAGGALIIFVGAVWAFARFATTGLRRRSLIGEFNKIRLSLGVSSSWGWSFSWRATSCVRRSRPASPKSASWRPSLPFAPSSTSSSPARSRRNAPRSKATGRSPSRRRQPPSAFDSAIWGHERAGVISHDQSSAAMAGIHGWTFGLLTLLALWVGRIERFGQQGIQVAIVAFLHSPQGRDASTTSATWPPRWPSGPSAVSPPTSSSPRPGTSTTRSRPSRTCTPQ